MKRLEEEEVFTAAEVTTAIKRMKSGIAAGEDEIRTEMLKALTGEGILKLTPVCQVAWKYDKNPRDWQTDVISPIFKKRNRKQCTPYRGISLLNLPWKAYTKCLERKCREKVESLKQIFEKSWEYGKDLFSCFVGLETAYYRGPQDKLRKVLREYGVGG